MIDKRKILIVEDEEVIRNLCRRLLAPMGLEAAFASGAGDAMKLIAAEARVDLLISDMKLPDGDGGDVIAAFRKKFPASKVLVMTGSPTSDGRERRLSETGVTAVDILFKPFARKEFESAVRRCLDGAAE